MSAKYPNLTSYNYCANNPVMMIDPNGSEIDEASKEEWGLNKNAIIRAQKRLEDKYFMNKQSKGLMYKDEAERYESLGETLKTMDIVENSDDVYKLKKTNSAEGEFYHDPKDKLLTLEYKNVAGFVHELDHAGQFESGDLILSTGKVGGIVDLSDERSAYMKQAAYDPNSLPTSKSNAPKFSNDWLLGIGNGKYKGHGITPINVSSSKSDYQKAYPNQSINLDQSKLRYKK